MTFDTLDAYWQDIHNIPQLSDSQERELAIQIQQGNEKALNRLVTSNLRFVVSVARQYADRGLSMDDLISEGNIALMTAARKWQPKDGVRFVNFAVYDVRKAMEQALPQQSQAMTMPKNGADGQKELRSYSTDAPMRPGQVNTLGDMLKAGKPDANDMAEDNEISYGIMRALHFLNQRERIVITEFYGVGTTDHMTMAEIAEQTGLKRERVRQIRKTAERKMRRIMKRLP